MAWWFSFPASPCWGAGSSLTANDWEFLFRCCVFMSSPAICPFLLQTTDPALHLGGIQSAFYRGFAASAGEQPLCIFGCFCCFDKVTAHFILSTSLIVLSWSLFLQSCIVCRNIECFIVFHASSLCLLPQTLTYRL